MTPSVNVNGLKQQIEPCIWKVEPISQQPVETEFHIETKVVLDEQKDTFYKILEKGIVNNLLQNSYSQNFEFFLNQSQQYAQNQPLHWEKLIVILLNNCIIFPIECDTQDTALTIFSTLNDRGLPLSDSDIFKAKIYGFKQAQNQQDDFIEDWKELSEICKQAKISVDDIFRYYTHVIRAENQDTSKEIALKKFYENNTYNHLQDSELISDLIDLAKFWKAINNNETQIGDGNVTLSLEALKYLHCLKWYTNEFWKYPVNVFFIKNRKDGNFDNKFRELLEKLISFLFVKFLETPTVTAIKNPMYNLGKEIFHNLPLPTLNLQLQDDKIQAGFSEVDRLTRALLLLEAYLHPNQTSLIPENFDIEHIFPKKWQDTNYNGWNQNDAQVYLEKLGNKVVIEKKVNILAGNGYFAQKKSKYDRSEIAVVKDLANYPSNNWQKEDIDKREQEIRNKLISFFKENLEDKQSSN